MKKAASKSRRGSRTVHVTAPTSHLYREFCRLALGQGGCVEEGKDGTFLVLDDERLSILASAYDLTIETCR